MIIDRILDRKESASYNPFFFYLEMLNYEGDEISRAMDYGTEEDVKTALCNYIDRNEYNPQIKDYIRSVDWLTATHTNA